MKNHGMRKIGRSRSRMLEQAESANAMPLDNNTDDTQSRAEVKKKKIIIEKQAQTYKRRTRRYKEEEEESISSHNQSDGCSFSIHLRVPVAANTEMPICTHAKIDMERTREFVAVWQAR